MRVSYEQMVNEHGQLYCDSIALSFNVHFFRLLKWLLVLPVMAMSAVLLLSDFKSALPLSF